MSKGASLTTAVALVGAAVVAFVVYRLATKGAGAAAAVGGAVVGAGEAVNDALAPGADSLGTWVAGLVEDTSNLLTGRRFPVLNGTVLSVAADGKGELRAYNWTERKFQPLPGVKLPANWKSAPLAKTRFYDLRAQGKPWYEPWDGVGIGLSASFA